MIKQQAQEQQEQHHRWNTYKQSYQARLCTHSHCCDKVKQEKQKAIGSGRAKGRKEWERRERKKERRK